MALSGCMTSRMFIDSPLPLYSYEQLTAREPPLHLEVIAEYQLNGVRVGANGAEFFKLYEPIILEIANEVFERSKLVVPSSDGVDGKIKVVMNSDGHMFPSLGMMMTWGLMSSTVTTHYDIEVIVALKNKVIRRFQTNYDVHLVHTAVGKADLPNGVEMSGRGIDFRVIVEQSLLKVLKEMGPGEEQGIVPMNSNTAGS